LPTHLAHTCALISAEAAAYAIGGWWDGGQAVSICLFGIGSHAGHGEDLLVLLHSLLELCKEDAQAWTHSQHICGAREGSRLQAVPPA